MLADHAELCNTELKDEGASVREIVLNAICLFLLVAILAPVVGYLAERWFERFLDHPQWHPQWREPLDDWTVLSDSGDPLERFTDRQV
jgi:hypothetical protein